MVLGTSPGAGIVLVPGRARSTCTRRLRARRTPEVGGALASSARVMRERSALAALVPGSPDSVRCPRRSSMGERAQTGVQRAIGRMQAHAGLYLSDVQKPATDCLALKVLTSRFKHEEDNIFWLVACVLR
jgi:hypothetical protein